MCFFSVHQDGASGSIIDFIQNRQGGSLGTGRKELRAWLGQTARSRPPKLPAFPALPQTGKDRMRVETDLCRADSD